MEEIITVEAKHIFIDIVNYTHQRSVEAQSDIIKILNSIVNESIAQLKIDESAILFIPTGDGMCISLLDISTPYDIHLKVAIDLLKKLHEYNIGQSDEMRKFSIRIGINENIDNLIIDINGRRNISGTGINMASRIEGLGDSNQIIVGRSVYDKLISREKYMNSFAPYSTIVKHGVALNVYQFKDSELEFLNNETPSLFIPKKQEKRKLDQYAGHYIAICIKHKDLLFSKINNTLDVSALHCIVHLATLDAIDESKATKLRPNVTNRVSSIDESLFNEIRKSNTWVNHELRFSLIPIKLLDFIDCFDEPYLLINDNGKNRLKLEQPSILKKYNLNDPDSADL